MRVCVCVCACVSLIITFTLISTRLWENFSITLSIHMRGFTCQTERGSGQGQRGEHRAALRCITDTHQRSDTVERTQRDRVCTRETITVKKARGWHRFQAQQLHRKILKAIFHRKMIFCVSNTSLNELHFFFEKNYIWCEHSFIGLSLWLIKVTEKWRLENTAIIYFM